MPPNQLSEGGLIASVGVSREKFSVGHRTPERNDPARRGGTLVNLRRPTIVTGKICECDKKTASPASSRSVYPAGALAAGGHYDFRRRPRTASTHSPSTP